MKKLAPFLFLLLLCGCMTPEELARRDAEIRAADDAKCIEYGFKKGTADFANCRLQVDQQRQQNKAMLMGLSMNRPIMRSQEY